VTNAKRLYAEGLGIGALVGGILVGALIASKSIWIERASDMHGVNWLWVIVWAAIAIVMAIAEEAFVRGYVIYSLSRVIGFGLRRSPLRCSSSQSIAMVCKIRSMYST